jgi:Kef-type K+ transport system membrane component KefB
VNPVPPIAADQLLTLLVQLCLLLAVALLLGRLAARIGMPAIVGELLAGVLIGPSVLGHAAHPFYHWVFPGKVDQMHLLDAIGQLGVLLLVGIAGAHLDVRSLPRRGSTALRISVLDLTIPLGLGITAGYLAPKSLVPPGHDRIVFAMFLGVAMCVTAIPVIAKTLADMKLMHREIGQLTLTAGTVDDTVGWFVLSVVSAMATIGLRTGPLLRSLGYLVGFVVLAYLIGRPLVKLVFRWLDRYPEAEPSIGAAAVLVLAGGLVTQSMHMEAVFGAFVAGVLIGSPGAANPKKLAPLRAVVLSALAPIFLATAGLRMDLTTLRRPVVLVGAVVAVCIAIVGKFVGAYIGARWGKMSHWEGLALGAGMNSRGVVEIVVALAGLRLGVLDVSTYTIIALVAVVTSMMAPPLLRLAMSRVAQNEDELLRLEYQSAWATTVEPATR